VFTAYATESSVKYADVSLVSSSVIEPPAGSFLGPSQ
jgi:hypothetical protein